MKKLAGVLLVVGVIAAQDAANVRAQSSPSLAGAQLPSASSASLVPEVASFTEVAVSSGASVSRVPEAAFFGGLGGSLDFVNFTNQNVYAQGNSIVFQNGAVAATGSAAGPADPQFDTQVRLAPVAQGGYFQHFSGSNWLWGAKLSYGYIGSTAADHDLLIPQVGSFTTTTPTVFTGNVFVKSYEASVNHQFALTPFIGRSFENSFLYLGGGPTLSQTSLDMKGVIGFADIAGSTRDITGIPTSFSSSEWTVGGAAIAGLCYFFTPSWFLDVGYTFAATSTPSSRFAGPFVGMNSGFTSAGILSGNYSGNAITHTLAISINRAF